MNNKVYVLLPVHNRKNITLKFVSLLKQQDHLNYCLVLIDDGSTDGTAEEVCKELPQTIMIKGVGNWWWAGSLHQAYKWLKEQKIAENDLVLIMNDDTEIKPDFISKGISIMDKNKNTLLLATAYDLKTGTLDDWGISYDQKGNHIAKAKNAEEINCLSTRGLFLKANDFVSLGGFHPFLLPHYISDYEFTMRAHRKGYQLVCSDELKLWFDNSTTGLQFKDIEMLKWRPFCKLYFSKRFVGNPIYAINFYMLTFSFPYNFKHAFIQLKESVKTLFRVLRYN